MKKIVGIDADDTLFDENNAVRQFINETYGFTHTEEDYLVKGEFGKYWERIWDVEPEKAMEMYEQFLASSHKKYLPPIEGALDAIKSLKQQYELLVITSRGQAQQEITYNSLAKHYPDVFKEVIFVPLWRIGEKVTKAEILLELDAKVLIDDNLEHCTLAAKEGIRALLFGDYGWNRSENLPKGVCRAKNWASVQSLLLG